MFSYVKIGWLNDGCCSHPAVNDDSQDKCRVRPETLHLPSKWKID